MLRRLFPFFCCLAALVTFGYALYDPYQIDGDALSYMDVGDALRAHHWAAIVNGYWHPMYPAMLSLFHALFHSTLANELHAYYLANYAIFLLEMAAIVAFTDALLHLRSAVHERPPQSDYVLQLYPMRYLGLALLLIASQRELSLGKVRPDALLQALLLFAIAALLRYLATDRMRYAALMGFALGCAYLTKSFAFLFAFLSVGVLAVFAGVWLKRSMGRAVAAAALSLVCFGIVAGPYVAALSRQKGRFDFGDSGSLNYAWYVDGTEKMHLQPYMTDRFGWREDPFEAPRTPSCCTPRRFSAMRSFPTAPSPTGTTPPIGTIR